MMVKILSFICLCVIFHISDVQCDRAPPGVNPQMYNTGGQNFNHPPPPQGAQQPPQGFGQPPVQQAGHFATPQQSHQHQANIAHGSPQQHVSTPGKPVLNAANIQHEKEHIAEHMEVPLDTSKMSEQELQFHYFKMHDSDNNNKLDGCELIKSLIHWHEIHEPADLTDELFEETIDDILSRLDLNWDGYIDYFEYASSVTLEQVKEFHEEYEAAKTTKSQKLDTAEVDQP